MLFVVALVQMFRSYGATGRDGSRGYKHFAPNGAKRTLTDA
jgi:hypothetical protein